MARIQALYFGDYNIVNANVDVYQVNDFVSSARNIDETYVPGRTGAVIRDRGTFDNIKIQYQIVVHSGPFDTAVSNLKIGLLSQDGYQLLRDSRYADYLRYGYVSQITPHPGRDQGGIIDVTFDCLPQRFRQDGLTAQTYTATGSIENAYMPATPLITVTYTDATAAAQFRLGDTLFRLLPCGHNTVTIDCYHLTVYDGNDSLTNYVFVSKTGGGTAVDYGMLEHGTTDLTFVGNISQIDVTPRWWV